MERRGIIAWIALGLAGIALVAGVSLAASSLSGQKIGLASEPMSAGNSLAPTTADTRAAEARARRALVARRKERARRRARERARRRQAAVARPAPSPAPAPRAAPAPPAPPAPRVDDHGGLRDDGSVSGSDDARNRGSGSSDDD